MQSQRKHQGHRIWSLCRSATAPSTRWRRKGVIKTGDSETSEKCADDSVAETSGRGDHDSGNHSMTIPLVDCMTGSLLTWSLKTFCYFHKVYQQFMNDCYDIHIYIL